MSRAAARRAGIALLWCATLAGGAYGLTRLDTHARQRAAQSPCRLELIGVPDWARAAGWVVDDVRAAAALPPDADLFDPALCDLLAANVQTCGWVQRVQRVAKRANGVIAIHASFRTPRALVEHQERLYLVDDEGVRLPTAPARLADVRTHEYFIITGVRNAPPLEGRAWGAPDGTEDLHAGLALVRTLEALDVHRMPLRASIRSVDVGNWRRRENAAEGQLRLRTTDPPTVVQWGLAPGDEGDIEPAARDKLELLRKVFTDHGRLPSRTEIDLRPPRGVLRSL
ncbi:MAG: hypothetical protein AB7Q17_09690 [Phycisphaerae bacterium]